MPKSRPHRLLSIGEFAAATQLSSKALRLYDEQRLLAPAHIDPTTGYRYYHADQVAKGRLIRALRQTSLSLVDIASVIVASGAAVDQRLSRLARELDYRYAQERQALMSALLLVHATASSAAPAVRERTCPAMTVAVQEFTADARGFLEQFQQSIARIDAALASAAVSVAGSTWCRLLEPLGDEEGRLEVLVPIEASATARDISFRRLPEMRCAVIQVDSHKTHAADLAAGLDTVFDWFDRNGYVAADVPWLSLDRRDGIRTEILWPFDASQIS